MAGRARQRLRPGRRWGGGSGIGIGGGGSGAGALGGGASSICQWRHLKIAIGIQMAENGHPAATRRFAAEPSGRTEAYSASPLPLG